MVESKSPEALERKRNREMLPLGIENEILNSTKPNKEKSHEQREEMREQAEKDIAKQFENEKPQQLDIEITEKKRETKAERKPITPRPQAEILQKAPKQLKKEKYRESLRDIRAEMSATERAFSRLIHAPGVEKASEIAGHTIARPNALFFGALTSLVLVGAAYLIARYYGYVLSGFEWIGTYLLGWAIGLIIDWVRVTLLNRRIGPA